MLKNACCINSNGVKCQLKWMESWLEGMPIRYSVRELREEMDIGMKILEMGKDPLVKNEVVVKRMILMLFAGVKRMREDEMIEHVKECLLKYSLNADHKKILHKIIISMDDDMKIKFSFLNL